MTPETDAAPVKSYSSEWSDPVPVGPPINTAGAEDSPFVMPDGKTLYFFFAPDVRVPVEKQLLNGVTGIYVSKKDENGNWGEPERVVLQDPGKLSLDGCEFVQGNTMLFCTAREGYVGMHWFTAEYKDGKWQGWENADFNPDYEVGELHITTDGKQVYFHSARPGGKGALDIWMSEKMDGSDGLGGTGYSAGWGEPVNIAEVNMERDDGWPFVSEDGNELWTHRDYGLWRSKKVDGKWTTPELMFSPLAGEATIDNEGNLYFVHHFFKNDTMIEADIYTAHRK
jgi:hypothetical protein